MEKEIAKILLEIKAVHLNPDNFFTWTSGIKSPIYCDNRQIISYPKYRAEITKYFCQYIKENYPDTDLIAGTATAGIPWAAWISHELELPMIYIRGGNKGHGLKNALEGSFQVGQKTLIIEDLISTGKSSVAAALEAKESKLDVQAVVSIFNYGFKKAEKCFFDNAIPYHSLSSLETMLQLSKEEGLLSQKQIDIIKEWKISVEN